MIKSVGGTEIKRKHRASCHCGAVVLDSIFPMESLTQGAATVRSVEGRAQSSHLCRYPASPSCGR